MILLPLKSRIILMVLWSSTCYNVQQMNETWEKSTGETGCREDVLPLARQACGGQDTHSQWPEGNCKA